MQREMFEQFYSHLQAGGETMIPLLMVSIVMWTLVIVKLRYFFREKGCEVGPDEVSRIITEERPVLPAGTACWQRVIVTEFRKLRCRNYEIDRESLEALRVRQEVEVTRHIGTILILSAIAPLLGLLGTVTGMISTFDIISISGTGNARALASGISEALVTTQSGLVVAVPGMLLGGLLYRCASKVKGRMEIFCLDIQAAADGITEVRS